MQRTVSPTVSSRKVSPKLPEQHLGLCCHCYPPRRGDSYVMMVAEVTSGRICLSLVAAFLAPAPFVADWNHTHIFNPKWTPHAKFHNGQTMAMAVALSMAIFYYTWRSDSSPNGDSVKTATVFASLYWVTAFAAYFFPGSLPVDPEFGTGFPQLPGFLGMLILSWIGCWLEMRRLAALKIE